LSLLFEAFGITQFERVVFENTRLSLIQTTLGVIVRIHQEVPKHGAILYESIMMVDKEFAQANGVYGTSHVFTFKKDGMEDDFWETIKGDVSFHCYIILMYVQNHPTMADNSEFYMRRYFKEA
jgi:4-hydroxy-3-methylbut-2-enyl diphosphate reductase IspH